jgi:acetolactate synthase-1/2/3 large subunit
MNGAESLARTLLACGVDTCFANPGTSEMHFVAALDRVPGIRAVLALFEGVATGAADGYARMAASRPRRCSIAGRAAANARQPPRPAGRGARSSTRRHRRPITARFRPAAETETWATDLVVAARRRGRTGGQLAAEAVRAAAAPPGASPPSPALDIPEDGGLAGAARVPAPAPSPWAPSTMRSASFAPAADDALPRRRALRARRSPTPIGSPRRPAG